MSVHREIPLDFDGVLADEGNGSVVRRSVLPGHRQLQRAARQGQAHRPGVTPGLSVATRPLGVYELVARHLGAQR